jgi:prepilin-type processing-associated H-X9-DG protein
MQVPTPQFKYTRAPRPAQLVCVSEISGSNDPLNCDGNGGSLVTADAAWLDGVWAALSGPGNGVESDNGRLQTAWAKHDNRVNVLYVDGHAGASLASQLTWGLFWGVYGDPPTWPGLPPPQHWNSSISTPSYDSQVWSNLPE